MTLKETMELDWIEASRPQAISSRRNAADCLESCTLRGKARLGEKWEASDESRGGVLPEPRPQALAPGLGTSRYPGDSRVPDEERSERGRDGASPQPVHS